MTQFFEIHPDNPQQRLLRGAAEILHRGGVIAYPTDSAYALGCLPGERDALERVRRIRRLTPAHNMTLVCRNLSELAVFAKVDTAAFRLLKAYTPGPYTFLLQATNEVPRRLLHPKRRTIGLRVPDHAITQALLAEIGGPLLSTTLILPDEELPMADPHEIREQLQHSVDLVIDGGACSLEPTSVISLISGTPEVIRVGRGDVSSFG